MTFRIFLSGIFALLLTMTASGCTEVRSRLVSWFTPDYEVAEKSIEGDFEFTEGDVDREKIPIALEQIAAGFEEPTDLQFIPGRPDRLVVLEKTGAVQWIDLASQKRDTLLRLDVLTASEQGLLGLAFHPDFAANGRFVINYTAKADGKDTTLVELWQVQPDFSEPPQKIRTLLSVRQPYPNHNAGQLAFGPDGYLYVGFGDGGWMDDPHGHGQNPATMLGSMLRIDIDQVDDARPYAIPADNPFLGREGYLPETWAYGFRNPWRYSFDGSGRLFVADVGQDKWEEINLVVRGGNYGWNAMEGRHCFPPGKDCDKSPYRWPIYEYGRNDGQSLTGGYVYEADDFPALHGKYIFADFVQGRFWAIEAPQEAPKRGEDPGLAPVYALGRRAMLPSTFGRDAQGRIYVADFAEGTVYRIVEP